MNKDTNRRILAIQAKKKRRKLPKKPHEDRKNVLPTAPNKTPDKGKGHANQRDSDSSSNESDEGTDEMYASDEEEQEESSDYCKGGYHPVQIGDVFLNRWGIYFFYAIIISFIGT